MNRNYCSIYACVSTQSSCKMCWLSNILLLDWIWGVWDCCVCTSDWQPWELKGKQYLTELFWQLGSLGRHGKAGFFLISGFYQPLSAVFLIFTHRPHIKSPHGAEQALLWLRNDGKEQKTCPISVTPQQVLGIRTRGVACYKLGRTPDVRRRGKTGFCVNRHCCSCWLWTTSRRGNI